MNMIDTLVVILAIIGAISGFKKGLIRILAEFLGLVGGVYLASLFGVYLGRAIGVYAPQVENYALWIGFAVIFVISYIAAFVGGKAAETALGLMMLGPINRLAGMFVGMLAYLIFVGAVLIFMSPLLLSYTELSDAYHILNVLGF